MGYAGSWEFFSLWLEGGYEQCMKLNSCLLIALMTKSVGNLK